MQYAWNGYECDSSVAKGKNKPYAALPYQLLGKPELIPYKRLKAGYDTKYSPKRITSSRGFNPRGLRAIGICGIGRVSYSQSTPADSYSISLLGLLQDALGALLIKLEDPHSVAGSIDSECDSWRAAVHPK
jgi:hypothetical protein